MAAHHRPAQLFDGWRFRRRIFLLARRLAFGRKQLHEQQCAVFQRHQPRIDGETHFRNGRRNLHLGEIGGKRQI